MYGQQMNHQNHANHIINHLAQAWIYYVAQNYPSSLPLAQKQYKSDRMLAIESYILSNFRTVTLGMLAKHFNLSLPYASNIFHSYWGVSFTELLISVKLEKAKELLEKTNMCISEICSHIGYEADSYFIALFKRKYGFTPGQYRKEHRSKAVTRELSKKKEVKIEISAGPEHDHLK